VRRAQRLRLLPAEERALRKWAGLTPPNARRALRARVVLELAQGGSYREVGVRAGVHPETVARWRRRFEVNRTDGILRDAPRVRPRDRVSPALVERIVRTTREETPPDGGRWTTRSLARTLRVNHMLVHRVWQAERLSSDREEAMRTGLAGSFSLEVVGVFFGAPAVVAVALCRPESTSVGVREAVRPPQVSASISGGYRPATDERTALGLLEALDRAHEAAAPPPGAGRQRTHELLVFLRGIEERVDADSEIHVFFDRRTHEPDGRADAWLAVHPRIRAHHPFPGETWTGTIDRWIRQGPPRASPDDRIRVSAGFNESIARVFAARYPGPVRVGTTGSRDTDG
jgi:transposase